MMLLPDWKILIRRAWSVRLSLLAALASAGEAAWQLYLDARPSILIVGTALISLGAAVSRLIAQPKMRNGRRDRSSD